MAEYDEYASREFEKYGSELLAASPLVLVETQDALTVRNDGGPVYEIDSPTPHDRAMARRIVKATNNHEPLLLAAKAALALLTDDGTQGGPKWTIGVLRKAIQDAEEVSA